jgi:hypothetical protein
MSESTSQPPRKPSGWVYFIRAGEHVKIGWSRNPKARRDTLATASPFDLEIIGQVPGTEDDERALHGAFAHLHVKREWFRADPALLALVRWTANYDRALGVRLQLAGEVPGLRQQLSARQAQVSALEAQVSVLTARLKFISDGAEKNSGIAWRGHDALQKLLAEHLAEIERAIDATDDHDGLADVVREAATDLSRKARGPLSDCFQGGAGVWRFVDWLQNNPGAP